MTAFGGRRRTRPRAPRSSKCQRFGAQIRVRHGARNHTCSGGPARACRRELPDSTPHGRTHSSYRGLPKAAPPASMRAPHEARTPIGESALQVRSIHHFGRYVSRLSSKALSYRKGRFFDLACTRRNRPRAAVASRPVDGAGVPHLGDAPLGEEARAPGCQPTLKYSVR